MKKIIAAMALMLLASCSTTKSISVKTIPVERAPLVVPSPDATKLRDVKWVVVTKENFEAIMAALEASGKPLVLFAVTDDGLEALQLNLAEVQKLIQQQKTIIAAYEEYYNGNRTEKKTK